MTDAMTSLLAPLGDATGIANEPDFANNTLIAALGHYGLLGIDGAEAERFLQGQLTCSMTDVNPEQSSAGAYCTPKGRMITSFQIACLDGERFRLRMRRELIDTAMAVLAKYIVFSKAKQQSLKEQYQVVGISGPQAGAKIAAAFGAAPSRRNGVCLHNQSLAIAIGENIYECWLNADDINTLLPILSKGLEASTSELWELLMIRQGLADVTGASSDAFAPQSLNYHITGAVSFNKGCYTGQEIVARMQYRGKLKRRLYRARVNDNAHPMDDLFNSDSEQSIGQVINAVRIDNCSELLAVISNDAAEANDVHLGKDGPMLQLLPLPYAISSEDN